MADLVNGSSNIPEESGTNIVTISSGTAAPMMSPQNWAESQAPRLQDCLDCLYQCRLMAQGSKFKPDFISLTTHWAVCHESSFDALTDTIITLTEQSYSVHMKLIPYMSNISQEEQTIFFLLAAPFCTNPQWLDNIFSDIGSFRTPIEQVDTYCGFVNPDSSVVPEGLVKQETHSKREINESEQLDGSSSIEVRLTSMQGESISLMQRLLLLLRDLTGIGLTCSLTARCWRRYHRRYLLRLQQRFAV